MNKLSQQARVFALKTAAEYGCCTFCEHPLHLPDVTLVYEQKHGGFRPYCGRCKDHIDDMICPPNRRQDLILEAENDGAIIDGRHVLPQADVEWDTGKVFEWSTVKHELVKPDMPKLAIKLFCEGPRHVLRGVFESNRTVGILDYWPILQYGDYRIENAIRAAYACNDSFIVLPPEEHGHN